MAPPLVDAHVHLHDCFDCVDLLEGAARNFEAAARDEKLPVTAPGMLLFADPAGANSLERLRATAADGRLADWRLEETRESGSLRARGGTTRRELLLLSGRQIATKEGLEILMLACEHAIPDGLDLFEAIAVAQDRDAIVVLAWGFGKWWFHRGRLAARAVRSASGPRILLGDNGGRSRVGARPTLFQLAEQHDVLVLPGSDPLPFPGHVARVGSYGFVSSGTIDPAEPAATLKALLHGMTAQPRTFGQLQAPWSFFRDQVRMQVRKQLRRR